MTSSTAVILGRHALPHVGDCVLVLAPTRWLLEPTGTIIDVHDGADRVTVTHLGALFLCKKIYDLPHLERHALHAPPFFKVVAIGKPFISKSTDATQGGEWYGESLLGYVQHFDFRVYVAMDWPFFPSGKIQTDKHYAKDRQIIHLGSQQKPVDNKALYTTFL